METIYSDAIEQYESNASNIHRPKLQTSRTIPSGQLFSRMNLNSSYVIETPRSNKITTNIPKIPKILNSRSQLRQNAMVNSSNRRDNKSFENNDNRVPFWNIAHMINSINQIELAINSGSNGIETDITFDSRGIPVETYHGFPCDCGRHCHHREEFVQFVQHLAKTTVPPASSRLLLVLFDLKLKELDEPKQKETAGRYLAKILNENLYSIYQQSIRLLPKDSMILQPPVRVIISINHASDSVLVKSFIKYMRDNHLDFMSKQIGFDVGMNDDLNQISSMWDDLNGATFNIWQGDGLTNCANIVRGIDRLKDAISIRNNQGHFRKIYYWTADIMYHIRSVLRLGLDAILTNQPQRVLQILDEPEFKTKYRPATPYDDPFQQFWIKPSAWKMSPPTLSEAFETVTNIHETSANFVKTLPDGISAILKKVHHSISSTIK